MPIGPPQEISVSSEPTPETPVVTSGAEQPSPPPDYYAILSAIIDKATIDPAEIRQIVYALAWHHFRAEALLSPALPNAESRAKTVWALERARELADAIEQLEADAASQTPRGVGDDTGFMFQQGAEAAGELIPPSHSSEQTATSFLRPPQITTFNPAYPNEPVDVPASRAATLSQPANQKALVVHSKAAPAWMQNYETTAPGPDWQDNGWEPTRSLEYGPIERRTWSPSFVLFAQLAGAAILSVALFVGIFGWLYVGRPSAVNWTAMIAPRSINSLPTSKADDPGTLASNQLVTQPVLPFPLPKTYGIYAASKGQLTELEALPVKIPDARIQLSSEIIKPSTTMVSGDELAFVVFRRDLVNNAPQTVSARVVASVVRETKFVDRRAQVVPVEASWRIRSKAFTLKVSPVEGGREMILIRPSDDFVFPAGRYALVVNGVGYDFTVSGPITAIEQCLERMEAVNGAVLSECRKP